MAEMDLNRVLDAALVRMQAIDLKAGCLALATARGDSLYATHNPVWIVEAGQLNHHEAVLPMARIDLLDWPHQNPRRSSDNYVQEWWLQCLIAFGTLGLTAREAERRALDAATVYSNAWLGSGPRFGLDPAESSALGLHSSWLTSGGWLTQQRSDGFMAISQLLLTIEIRVQQAAD
jgi:hypothetical protein